ncbi:AfsR/SARP family transcriptional regulator [Actinokineospora sp. UTMC 2448]|uniref:AfsR/SARP family transcriptional regulator n=1 Tax=Actinokineospora sp. UTMC 2448 TaxID=2268449 RepID=UPI00220C5F9E|nr:AfsR/SARP family transcriptional regulator [Actinokineospora sp. UTMC 2448]UVS81449.1 Transcriptional regulatory protein EmbR [Actinokineospora sp. UTMC 2448]
MRMSLLGPVVISAGGVDRAPTAPKVRQLLAFLMLNADTVVRSSECIEELWAHSPPKSAMSTLQTYVLEIRRTLRAAGGGDGLLHTRNPGYQLDGRRVDWVEFQRLASAGRAAAAAGDHRQASARLSDALALWRGPALADVNPGPLSAAKVIEFEESRKVVLEQRIEADLALGRHRELLDELEPLTAAYPTHESIHAQYMVALCRCDQSERALAVYQRLRAVLVDNLGVEPTPRLRRLRQAVLSQEPVLSSARFGGTRRAALPCAGY